jgi:hypothetical protein
MAMASFKGKNVAHFPSILKVINIKLDLLAYHDKCAVLR